MAQLDLSRLRTDQLDRLIEVSGDLKQLSTEELDALIESQEDVSDFDAGVSIAESNIRMGVAGIADLLGFDEFAKGQSEEALQEEENLQRRYTRDVPTFDDVQDFGDFGEYIKETAFTSLIPTGIGLGGGIIGGLVGGIPGAIAGATAFGTPFFTGANINRQMKELGLGFEDTSKAKALGVATGQALLDSVIGRVFGIFGRGAPKEIAKYAAPTLRGRAIKLGKKIGEGAAIEGITEPSQQILEILQANPDKFFDFPPEIQAELTEAAIAGGLLGGLIGGVTSPFTSDPTARAKEDLDQHMQELGREMSARQTTINEYENAQAGLIEGPRVFTETVSGVTQPSIEGAPSAPPAGVEKRALVKQLGIFQVESDAAGRAQDWKRKAKIDNYEIPRIRKKIAEYEAQEARLAEEQKVGPIVVEQEVESRKRIDTDPVLETGQVADEEAVGLSGTINKARDNQIGLTQSQVEQAVEDVAPPLEGPIQLSLADNSPANLAFANNPELGDLYQELVELEAAPQKKAFPINNKKKQIRDLLKSDGVDDKVADEILGGTPAQKQDILRLSQAAVEQEAEQSREEAVKFIDEIAPDGIGIEEKRTFDRQVERVRKMIGRRLRKLGLKDVDVALDETTDAGREGSMAPRGGRFIMSLAYKYVKPGMSDKEVYAKLSQVMNHEMIHAMKQMGLFNATEWASLTKAVRSQRYIDNNGNVRQFSYFDRAGALYSKPEMAEQGGYESLEEMQEEEAIAELFRDFRVAKKRNQMLKDERGAIKKIFDKIVRFFKGIGEDAHKEAKDVFEKIEAGELGRRDRNSAIAESDTTRESTIRRDVKETVAGLPVKTDLKGLRYQDVIEETEDGATERRRYIDTTTPEADKVTQNSVEILGDKVYDAYRNIARYQREWPETSMVVAQAALKGYPRGFDSQRINMPNPNAYGEDTFSSVLEHTNDLLHRAFGQNHGAEFYPVDNAVEKARRMLNYMQGYGDFPSYKEAVANEFRNHANAFGMTIEEWSGYITPYLNNYIDAHQSIPVYNEVQQYMNDAAIAVGQLDFEKARGNLNAFLNAVNAGPEAYFDAIQPAMVDADGNPVNLKRKTVHRAAERAGIDDKKGTERFSTLDAATDWYKDSVEKDQVVHGTLVNFPAFDRKFRDIGFHFGTEVQAYDRLNELGRFETEERKLIFPRFIKARINMTNPLMVPRDPIAWNSPSAVFDVLASGVYDTKRKLPQQQFVIAAIEQELGEGKFETRNGILYPHPEMTLDTIRNALKYLGYDGIIYINSVEGNQGDNRRFMPSTNNQSFIVFEPDQIWVEESEDLSFADIPSLERKPDYREIFDSQSFTENELQRALFEEQVDQVIALSEKAIPLIRRRNIAMSDLRLGNITNDQYREIVREVGDIRENPDLMAETRFWNNVQLDDVVDLPYMESSRRPEMFDIEYSLRGVRDAKTSRPDVSEEDIAVLTEGLSDHMANALDIEGISPETMRGIEDYTNAVVTALETMQGLTYIDPSKLKDVDRMKIQPTLGVQEKLTERMSRIDPPDVTKTGVVIGSPPGARTIAARNGLVNKLTRMLEHPFALTEKSKNWYEESGKAIREVTRGDMLLMDRVARLMALYSQGNSVGGNTTALVKSMYQIARGESSIEAGRFPETTAAVIPEILAAPEFNQSVKGVSDKIENFYRNLIDPARGTDTYSQASTMDKWMMRLLGYKVADDEEIGGSANLTATQYRYARDLLNRVGDSWERKTGEKLKPRQIQAALWTYKKNMDAFEDAKAEGKVKKEEDFTATDKNFNDYLIRATANITYETRPSESLPIIPFIHTAPRAVQNKLNWKIWNVLHNPDKTDRVMELLTTGQLYNSALSSGGYESRAVPNVVSKLVLEKDKDNEFIYGLADQYSALLGYILKQDAVAWFQVVPDSEATASSAVGYHIEFSQRLTPEQELAFQQELNNKANLVDRTYNKKQREAGVPEQVEKIPQKLGFTRIGDGYFVINFREGAAGQVTIDNEFEKVLKNAMANVEVETVTKFDRVRANHGYIYNDWSTNPNGEAYRDIFGPAGFGNLQSSVDSLASEVAEATREFGREYGGYEAGRRYDAPAVRKAVRTARDFLPRQTEQGQLSVDDYPTYESGKQGPESGRANFVGYHYSNVSNLTALDSQFHGTGKAGDEMRRSPRKRVMFYEQVGNTLPYPEIELGLPQGYGVKLGNIYDKSKDDYIIKELDRLDLKVGTTQRLDAFEQMVEDEGYDGYYNPNEGTGTGPTITVLGEVKVPVLQTMKDRERISAIAESDTIKYSTISPTGDFATFADEVIANDIPSGPFTNVMRKIVGAVEGEKLTKAFARNVVNRFLPAYELDERAYGTYQTADSVGRAMELSQQLVGRMQALMEIGPIKIDKDGNVTQVEDAGVGGINSIFRPLFQGMSKEQANQQERLFFAYAVARREKALRQKGRRGFVTKDMKEIDEVINRSPDLYREVFDNFQKFNEYTIQLGVDSGVLTREMAANLRDMAYIPFYREFGVGEGQDFGDSLPRRAANTFNNPSAFDKRLLGSEKKLQADLFENIFRNQQAILSASLKNVAMQKVAKAVETLNRLGQTDIGERVDVKESGPQIARFRVNGQEVAYKIKDGAMWKAIAGLTPPQKGAFIKFAEQFANLLRFGVTNMPGFMLANLWRGKVDAYVKVGNPMLRLDETARGMADVYRGGTDTMAIKLLTGFGGYGYGADPADFATTARRNIRTQGKVFNNQGFLDGLANLKQQMERVGESTEVGERVVIYRRMIEAGYSQREAAFQAMNLINYGRKGAGGGVLGNVIVHTLIPSIPFLNARIQGLYRLIESQDASPQAKRKAWLGIMTRGMMVSLASMLMWATGADDDDYENQSLENKINYDYFYYDDGKAIKLPRAFEIGSIFGTLPVMLLETIRQQDGSDLAKAAAMTMWNTFSFNPIPQVVLPAIEVWTGTDLFRGAPIEGAALQGKLDEERYYESTPYLYRWLSKNGGSLVNLSPLEIQQLMEGYLAGFGGLIAGVGDMVADGSGLVPDKPNGIFGDPYVTKLTQVAGLTRFVSEDGQGSSRFVRDFYDIKRSIDQYHRAVQDAAHRGDTERVQELLAEKGAAMSLRKAFNSVASQITTINNAIATISQSPTLTSDQKSVRLIELRRQKNILTKRFVQMAKSTGYF